jgi:hypothetical protein
MEPYLLPRMHERYFFAGEIFIFLAAMANRRFWPVAVALQIAAVLEYAQFLWEAPSHSVLATILMTLSLAFLLWFLRERSSPALQAEIVH